MKRKDKTKYRKAQSFWTGKILRVPSSSPHLITCAICNHVNDDSYYSPCRYCVGCLDIRNEYIRPSITIHTFISFIDLLSKHDELPF